LFACKFHSGRLFGGFLDCENERLCVVYIFLRLSLKRPVSGSEGGLVWREQLTSCGRSWMRPSALTSKVRYKLKSWQLDLWKWTKMEFSY